MARASEDADGLKTMFGMVGKGISEEQALVVGHAVGSSISLLYAAGFHYEPNEPPHLRVIGDTLAWLEDTPRRAERVTAE